jgi:hypothetical protein
MLVRESLLIFFVILIVVVVIVLLSVLSHVTLIGKGVNPYDIARNGLPVTLPWV